METNSKHTLWACLLFLGFLGYAKKNLHTVVPSTYLGQTSDSLEKKEKDIYKSDKSKVDYIIEQVDNTRGLSNSSVNTIFQDSDNLIWIGTWDGLNRHNGTNFKVFRPRPDDENSLNNQVVIKVDEDRSGRIWVVTMNGINSYDKKNDTFKRYHFPKKDESVLSENEFNIAIDRSGDVFCAVKDWGIGRFDGDGFKKVDTGNSRIGTIKKMEFASPGRLLLLFENNELLIIKLQTNGADNKLQIERKTLLQGIKDFGTISGLKICIVPINGKPEIFSLSDRSTLALNKGNIQKVIGNMSEGLVMTDESGPFVVNAKGITEKPTWSDFFNDSGITSIHKGPKDIIWAGTDGNGVLKLMPDNTSFNLVSTALVPEFEKGIVRAFQKVGKSSFFVGTKGKGLFKFTSGFDPLPEGPVEYKNYNEGNSRLNNSVYSLCMGREDILVIGSDDHGLAIFDLRKSQIVSWSQILDSHLYGDFSSVYAIYQDEDGFFWLGTNGYGLVRLKIERVGDNFKIGSFKVYKAQDGLSGGLSSNIIFSIEPRNDKELWIGTRLGGLNLFNRKTELFTVIKNNKKDATSLSNNDVLSLHLDKKKRLWVGTSFGLNLLESVENDTFQFKRFSDTDGLPDNTIHGIASGQNDDLWISTNMGVSRLNTLDHIFINFTQKDGLQNNEFSDGAYYQDTDNGYIYMGGIKGFNYFLPSKIHRSKHMPDLFIDEISGRNQSAPYFRNLVITPNSNAPPAITLNNDQNFFDVTLSALTYINNEKCQYAYQLKGFDQDWNMIGNQRTISFTNVPHGSYSLWVKWSNNDGVWGNSVRAMDITIRPYFWKSDWAVASYFVFFSLFLLFVFNYYKKQNSLRQNILFRKKEEEIHRNRLTFFTNIAHEFQTPLTLITGPSQRLSDAENIDVKHRKYIDMIRRNSSRLLLLTQQLLEFRKAEYDYLEVSVKQFDLVNLVEQIAELFDELALQNEIDYQLETQPQLYGWYDKDKIEKIIFNLLSNAFKYTPIQGSIKLSISKDKKYTAETLNITVTNSGKGIPKEKLNAIFERFIREKGVTSNTGAFRTGIGLAYVKKIVDVLNGQIKVDSKVGDLTTFTVLLPYGESAFQNHQFDDDSSHIFVSDHLRNIVEGTSDQEGKSVKNTPLEAFLNKKKVVLVVEDEKEVQMFIQELLREDYSILNASNGEEALRAIKKESPDLIISDVMMPVMDGVELCEKVKTNVNTHHIPFIMLTAKSSIIHRIEGLESGANSYIPKPFHPKHLQVRVQKLLEERESILKYFSTDIPIESLTNRFVKGEEKAFMENLIQLIQRNIENDELNTLFLEHKLGMSKSQLYRKIKETIELSPGDLIRTIRLKHAAHLLQSDKLTVSEVCYRSGFNNRSYFYREFKKMYHITPKNYQLRSKIS